MDKFEQKVQEVMEMSEGDRNNAIAEFKKSCICPTCPTYNECAKDAMEGLYCVLGKSGNCITMEKGCECPNCPLAQSLDVGVKNNTYCIQGSEMEQRGM